MTTRGELVSLGVLKYVTASVIIQIFFVSSQMTFKKMPQQQKFRSYLGQLPTVIDLRRATISVCKSDFNYLSWKAFITEQLQESVLLNVT